MAQHALATQVDRVHAARQVSCLGLREDGDAPRDRVGDVVREQGRQVGRELLRDLGGQPWSGQQAQHQLVLVERDLGPTGQRDGFLAYESTTPGLRRGSGGFGMAGLSGTGCLHVQPPVTQLDAHTLPRLGVAV